MKGSPVRKPPDTLSSAIDVDERASNSNKQREKQNHLMLEKFESPY